MTYDYAVIGGGIVGLATALAITERFPKAQIAVFEKESRWAAHQSGRNSGVIHSGIYYKPGSLKAKLGRDGNASMVRFCREHGVAHRVCGKLIIAAADSELPGLDALYARGIENGLSIRRLTPLEARGIEPHVRCTGAIHVPTTGVVDYGKVCDCMAALLRLHGCALHLDTRITGFQHKPPGRVVRTTRGNFEARFVVACAGLQSDRVARLDGAHPPLRIVPFRGEYFDVLPPSSDLVKTLIYPVPDPAFPFLGVHFTRSVDDHVHAGPNAVLSLAREGYTKRDFDLRDAFDTFSFPGFWRLAMRHAPAGSAEIARSMMQRLFARALQRLIPEVRNADLRRASPGIRAQAVLRSGAMVDDFLFIREEGALHVCNAPSPAATASLEIGKAIAAELPA